MLGAVAGLASRLGVTVEGMDAAAVSYPLFLEHIGTLA
jgi:5-enolpyruvylshikimate-3-phosphate synthase